MIGDLYAVTTIDVIQNGQECPHNPFWPSQDFNYPDGGF